MEISKFKNIRISDIVEDLTPVKLVSIDVDGNLKESPITTATFEIVTVASTTYSFLLTDANKKVIFTSATAVTATIPTNAVTAFLIGSKIEVTQSGNGVVTLVTTGLTVISASPLYLIKGQTVILVKTDINTWSIEGNNLNGEVRLPAYPSTRNDGVIPTNKVLSTDTNGNLKLYSIATAPAPFLDYVVPDSTLPSTTGNFQLHGSFFTPSMCLTANLATSIIFTGQTVNYAIFHSSNWIEVNITTGATEGSFSITLNNGLSATFNNVILIVLGDVFIPTSADWIDLTGSIDVSETGSARVNVANSIGTAKWNKVFNSALDYEVRFRPVFSPYLTSVEEMLHDLIKLTDQLNGDTYRFLITSHSTSTTYRIYINDVEVYNVWKNGQIETTSYDVKLRINKTTGLAYFYLNNVLSYTFAADKLQNNVMATATVRQVDVKNIKYIELAV